MPAATVGSGGITRHATLSTTATRATPPVVFRYLRRNCVAAGLRCQSAEARVIGPVGISRPRDGFAASSACTHSQLSVPQVWAHAVSRRRVIRQAEHLGEDGLHLI